MANTYFKFIREIINTPYSAYMSVTGIIFAAANYDTYHTNKITRTLAEKYNPNGVTCITIKNIFMCPVGRCNIYSINSDDKRREFITSELKVIVPPIIRLWDDEFYVGSYKS